MDEHGRGPVGRQADFRTDFQKIWLGGVFLNIPPKQVSRCTTSEFIQFSSQTFFSQAGHLPSNSRRPAVAELLGMHVHTRGPGLALHS